MASDLDPTGDPNEDFDDPVQMIVAQRRATMTNALTSLDDDPEKATRAQELSNATGSPPALVYGNLENFDQQTKAATTANLIKNNQYLAQYADSHPLAAKISNDDWGQLDTISQKLSKIGEVAVAEKAIKGFASAFEGPPGSSFMQTPKTLEESQSAGGWGALGAVIALGAAIPEGGFRVVSGLMTSAKQGGTELIKQITGQDVSDKAESILQVLSDPGLWASIGMPDPLEHISKTIEANHQLKQEIAAAAPYVKEGKPIPVGVSPVVDQLHADQAKLDMKNLDDAFSEAQKSSTKERSPELFADFVRQHTNAEMGITAEAVRKLYGGKEGEPIEAAPDDNKLGFIPDLQSQLALAEAHGGDVSVSLADWLAKVDPEVAKELHDNLRPRSGGMTLEEAKEGAKPVELEEPKGEEEEAPEITPIDSVRKSAGLDEPLAARSFKNEPAPIEQGIIPTSAKPYEGEEIDTPKGESFSPYLNFPLKDALNQIDSKHLTGIPAVLHEFYKDRLKKFVGDVGVHVVKDEDMKRISAGFFGDKRGRDNYAPAFYSPKHDEIFISDRIASGRMGHAYAAYAMMHEGAHALSVHAMAEHPELEAHVTAMMGEVKKYLGEEEPGLLNEAGHNYAFKNVKEFWAQAWSDVGFQHTLSMTPVSKELAKSIGMKSPEGKSIYDAFRRIIRLMMQKLFPGVDIPPTMVDALFHLQHQFELAEGKDRGVKLGANEALPAKPIEPELPGMTRVEDRELFAKASAIGMTKDQYQKYMSLIEKRQAEDLQHHQAQAEASERERQTKEWKENFSRVREGVREDLKSRPDLAADRLLRDGELYGEKVGHVELDQKALTEEQLKTLPKKMVGRDGANPDDVAGLFGYQSGDAMISALSRLEQERQMEGLTPAAHFSKIVDAETERQMRKDYGNLEQNILDEAKDHVISQTQMDILHEEMLGLGIKAHGEMSISKEDVKSWAKDEFNRTTVGAHSVDKYLASAGRAGARTEEELLNGNAAEAFKAKQQQYISILLANEAKKLEKQKDQFEKLAKRFSKREVAGIPAEYTNWVHDILSRTGNVVRRSVQDLQEAIGKETHGTLEEFANAKNNDARIWEQDENAPSDFQVMPVAPFLFNPAYRKTIDAMTPDEFRAVHNSIKTIVKNGQDENKIIVRGNKEDLKQTVGEMVEQLGKLFEGKEKQYAFGHKDQGSRHLVRTYWAAILQIESIFNRFDRGDPKGLFQRVITQPIFEGSHELNSLETKYSRMYKALPKFVDLTKRVANPLFGDPLRNGEKGPMTRGNLLAVLQNVGNPSQLDKLARGYKIEDKNAIMQWLFANTTKEDWDRAQALGDIFEKVFEESSQMYHSLSGVSPEKIDIRPLQTPFGEYRGWYHPLIWDPLRPGTSKKLMGQNPLEDGAYYRAATPSGYTKRRTGYAAPIQLSFDAIPNRLKSMLNDIAMRPAVTEAAKVFYDPKFQMAITKAYGKEITDLLLPYLKDIAGQKQFKDAAQATANRFLEYARLSVTATLIGPSTVMKHGPTAAMLSIKEVGASNFFRELATLVSMNDDLGERNWTFAMKGGIVDGQPWSGSEELQRRHRNWQETLTGAQADLFGENTLRNTVIKLGAMPVAISDLLSAVPTWLASYKEQIRAGEAHGDAVAMADRAVRRAHGSSAITARPRIMRGGALAQFATQFYTFFNEMFQRLYEMAWRAKDALEGRSLEQERSGEYKAGLKELPNLGKGLWAYVIFPALIEQMVSPIATGQSSTTEKVAAYGLRTLASSLPVVRDVVEAYLGGRDPTIGLYSTSVKMLMDAAKDVSKGKVAFDKAHAGNTIKHTITAFGALSGLANAQAGRTGEFVYNYATGKERPRDIGDVLRGLWHGTMKEQKR